ERGPVCATWLAPDPCASCTSCSGSDVAAGWLPLHGELIHKLYHVKNASNPDRRALPMASYRDLIGRDKLNDLDEILGISNVDLEGTVHAVKDNADALFTWNYAKGERPALNKLYEKAKTSQW